MWAIFFINLYIWFYILRSRSSMSFISRVNKWRIARRKSGRLLLWISRLRRFRSRKLRSRVFLRFRRRKDKYLRYFKVNFIWKKYLLLMREWEEMLKIKKVILTLRPRKTQLKHLRRIILSGMLRNASKDLQKDLGLQKWKSPYPRAKTTAGLSVLKRKSRKSEIKSWRVIR